MMRLLFTATAVITSSSAIYFYIFHKKLASHIQHWSHRGPLSTLSPKPTGIELVPEAIYTDQYYALYDYASKSVPRYSLPSREPTEVLFTKLVRRNMRAFAHFPQGLMMWAVCKTSEEKLSLKASHIDSLDFQVGDLVCGGYRVKVRTANKVEFEIKTDMIDCMGGRLAISFHEKEGEVTFCTETLMWKRTDEKRAMPLEKPMLQWMHELTAWWLIESGVKYLMDLES